MAAPAILALPRGAGGVTMVGPSRAGGYPPAVRAANGETRMSEAMAHLRALYRIDRQLIRYKKRLVAGNEELALLDRKIAETEAALKGVEEEIRAKTLEIDRVQLGARAAEAELATQDRHLRIAKNNTEYRITTDRIKELRRQLDEMETALLQGMEALDAGRSRLQATQTSLAESRAARVARAEKNESDATAIRAEQTQLKQRRQLAIEKVRAADDTAYALYDDALRRTKGDALGRLAGGVCQACFMRQNPAVINAAMVGRDLRQARCGGCGRILSMDAEDLTEDS